MVTNEVTSYKVVFNGKKKRGQLSKTPLSLSELSKTPLLEKLGRSFPETKEYDLLAQYKDEDGDDIDVNTDEDLRVAKDVFVSIKKVILFDLKASKKSSTSASTCAHPPPDSITDLTKQISSAKLAHFLHHALYARH